MEYIVLTPKNSFFFVGSKSVIFTGVKGGVREHLTFTVDKGHFRHTLIADVSIHAIGSNFYWAL